MQAGAEADAIGVGIALLLLITSSFNPLIAVPALVIGALSRRAWGILVAALLLPLCFLIVGRAMDVPFAMVLGPMVLGGVSFAAALWAFVGYALARLLCSI